MKYFIIREESDEGNVYVSDIPEGLMRKYQLLKGISRLSGWPTDLAARFSDDRPEGMRLTDWVLTPFGWLLISDRFKKLVEGTGVSNVEYLPIKMKNHKKKVVSDSYWIVNFLVLVEAVDRSKSAFEIDAAEDDKIFRFDRFVLRTEVEEKGPPVFRLKEQPQLVLVREDLATQINGAALTGLRLVETSKYMTYEKPA
jgi:hypothetical protein